MKLELKHLAAYLPYGLKIELTEDKSEDFAWQDFVTNLEIFEKGAIWELIGINKAEDLNIPMGEGYLDGCLFRNDYTYVNFHTGYKPILRPLSDLTKELYYELSGKTEKDSFGFWYGKHNGDNDKRDYIYHSGYYDKRYFLCDGYGQFTYKMMEFFLEHHFDIFGLIPAGLAIDINTLNN